MSTPLKTSLGRTSIKTGGRWGESPWNMYEFRKRSREYFIDFPCVLGNDIRREVNNHRSEQVWLQRNEWVLQSPIRGSQTDVQGGETGWCSFIWMLSVFRIRWNELMCFQNCFSENQRGKWAYPSGVWFLHHGQSQGKDWKLSHRAAGFVPRTRRPSKDGNAETTH